jgi:uncharacterized Zn finger protein
MIQLKSIEQLSKAIAKAKASNLLVQITNASRQYRVTNRTNGNAYTVDFFVRNGRRFGHCTCKGGARNYACKHLAAAAALNIWRASAGLNNRVATSH